MQRNATGCFEPVFVVIVVSVPLSRPCFLSSQNTKFQKALAQTSCIDPVFIQIDNVQSGPTASTSDITAKISTPDAVAANELFKNLSMAWSVNASVVFPTFLVGSSLSSLQVTACISGYELKTQSPSTCQLICPLGYYCNDGSSPAPAFPLFVDVKFSLKSTATNQPVRSKVGNALAAASGIDSNRVKYLNTSYDIISQRRLSDIQGLEYLTVYFQVDCDISNMATTVQSALQSQTSTLPAQ